MSLGRSPDWHRCNGCNGDGSRGTCGVMSGLGFGVCCASGMQLEVAKGSPAVLMPPIEMILGEKEREREGGREGDVGSYK